jgi:hypothetical protein
VAGQFVDQGGVTKLVYRFDAISRQTYFGTVSTLDEIGEDLKGKSQDLCPYDPERTEEGPHLRDTAYYGIFRGPEGPMLEVGYQAEYAIVQHEELEYHHRIGQAKYLEQPFLENRSRYRDMLFDAARRPIRG